MLLFSHGLSIKAVNLQNDNKSTLFDHLGGVYSLDFDYHNNMVRMCVLWALLYLYVCTYLMLSTSYTTDLSVCEILVLYDRVNASCIMSNASCTMSNASCTMSNASCTMSNASCIMSNASCTMSNASCIMSNASCTMSNASCIMSNASCTMSNASCTMSNASCIMSNASCTMSNASCIMSNASCTMSNASCIMSNTVQLKCNVACAHEQLKGSMRVTLLQHASILNPTRKFLRFNTRFPRIQHVRMPWILASSSILKLPVIFKIATFVS